MVNIPLHELIGTHREDLIRRWEAKVAWRTAPPTRAGIEHGIPLFLEQLVQELSEGSSQNQIGNPVTEHARGQEAIRHLGDPTPPRAADH